MFILNEDAAETIPGLLVMEFDQPARTGREQRLMADNAEQRELIAALQERNAVLARDLALLRSDLATLRGTNATPQRGCRIVETWIGDATVLCEVEYTPATEAIYDADHPGVGPGHDAEVCLIQVFVTGHWIDPTDFMSSAQIEAIEQRIYEEIEE